jgi:hypothetical protein
MLWWLLREGADVHQTDEFGETALMEAVSYDDLECVQILLEAGADLSVDYHGTALSLGRSREVILFLLEAGANPAHLDREGHCLITGRAEGNENALAAVSQQDFQRSAGPRFGKTNPERMQSPFWEAMIRAGVSAYAAREQFGKTGNWAFSLPVWCADRFGQSLTLLPDGRTIQVGGEHEDHYDPDFCIYNDVFVTERDGSVAIYGYPKKVFPPTDFHTATLVGNSIYLIGGLGYVGARRFGETPVYRLDVHALRIETLVIEGEAPGWIHGHQAAFVQPGVIRVWGGEVAHKEGKGELHKPNSAVFTLDIDRLRWTREAAIESHREDAG